MKIVQIKDNACGIKKPKIFDKTVFSGNYISSSKNDNEKKELSYPIYYNKISQINKLSAYKRSIQECLNMLGKKQIVLIMHGGSFPAESGKDTGFGSPNSSGARQLIDFISGIFTGIQLGPAGKTKKSDPSPYLSTLFSANPLFINLEELTEEKWDKILPKSVFNKTVAQNSKRYKAEANYDYAYNAYDNALTSAYTVFKTKDTPVILTLRREFDKYKNEENNSPWLDNDAIYEALSKKHNTDYWILWDDKLDRELILKKDTPEGKARIKEIREEYSDEIDFYKFCQFVYSKQIEETKQYAASKNIKLIADKQVGYSDRDVWAYQDMFLDGWNLGSPPDLCCIKGQTWMLGVLDPEKLYNSDGSAGSTGEIIKKSLIKCFKEYSLLRIDHFIGLVDPWVYPLESDTTLAKDGGGRLYSSPEHPILKKYSIITKENYSKEKIDNLNSSGHIWQENDYIDETTLSDEQIDKYSRFLNAIILPAIYEAKTGEKINVQKLKDTIKNYPDTKEAKEAEKILNKALEELQNSVIAEDIGALTAPVKLVMEKYGLSGIKVFRFMDAKDKNDPHLPENITEKTSNYWYMASNHDMPPVILWSWSAIENAKNHNQNSICNIQYIVDYLYKNSPDYEEKKQKCFEDPDFLTQSIYSLILKSPAENIQIFFADFFGEKRIYNTPGTSEGNWIVRAENNFIRQYNDALIKNRGVDFVKCCKIALQSKNEDKKAKEKK